MDNFLFFDNSLNPLYKSSNLVSISSSFPFIFNFLQDFLHRLLNFGVVFFAYFFFFQAESGIRDFCLSRGLGDVYKS